MNRSKRKITPTLESEEVTKRSRFIVDDSDEEYTETGDVEQENEYFGLDKDLLRLSLTQSLSSHLRGSKLQAAVSNSVEILSKSFDEYLDPIPKDEKWKIGLDNATVSKLEPVLKSIRSEIEKDTPTMEKILAAHMTMENKKKAVELFDILNNTERYTEEYLDLKKRINGLLKLALPSHEKLVENERFEKELKVSDSVTNGLKDRIFKLNAPTEIKAKIYEKYVTLSSLTPDDKDYGSLLNWIEHAVSLPYNNIVENVFPKDPKSINELCCRVKNKLDENVFGLEKVKQEILNVLVNRISNKNFSSYSLALTGSPGVGKTLILSSIADALNIPFERISIGGMTDPSVIKGNPSVYMGSTPGLIVQILKKIKYANGLVFIDEIDKLGETERAREVQYALLHITDLTTNKDFRDTYLSEIPIDLSKIMFVFAMNNEYLLDRALRDRLYIIKIPDYKFEEKKEIVKTHLLPKALNELGLSPRDVIFTNDAIDRLVRSFKSSNIRPIKDEIRLVVGRINLQKSVTLEDGSTGIIDLHYKLPSIKFPVTITSENIVNLMTEKPEDERHFLSMYT